LRRAAWILTLADGSLRRLTFDDGNEQLDGWSRDGRWIYYSTTVHDISSMSDVYRVRSMDGTPMLVDPDRPLCDRIHGGTGA
jgi:tricorn protease